MIGRPFWSLAYYSPPAFDTFLWPSDRRYNSSTLIHDNTTKTHDKTTPPTTKKQTKRNETKQNKQAPFNLFTTSSVTTPYALYLVVSQHLVSLVFSVLPMVVHAVLPRPGYPVYLHACISGTVPPDSDPSKGVPRARGGGRGTGGGDMLSQSVSVILIKMIALLQYQGLGHSSYWG